MERTQKQIFDKHPGRWGFVRGAAVLQAVGFDTFKGEDGPWARTAKRLIGTVDRVRGVNPTPIPGDNPVKAMVDLGRSAIGWIAVGQATELGIEELQHHDVKGKAQSAAQNATDGMREKATNVKSALENAATQLKEKASKIFRRDQKNTDGESNPSEPTDHKNEILIPAGIALGGATLGFLYHLSARMERQRMHIATNDTPKEADVLNRILNERLNKNVRFDVNEMTIDSTEAHQATAAYAQMTLDEIRSGKGFEQLGLKPQLIESGIKNMTDLIHRAYDPQNPDIDLQHSLQNVSHNTWRELLVRKELPETAAIIVAMGGDVALAAMQKFNHFLTGQWVPFEDVKGVGLVTKVISGGIRVVIPAPIREALNTAATGFDGANTGEGILLDPQTMAKAGSKKARQRAEQVLLENENIADIVRDGSKAIGADIAKINGQLPHGESIVLSTKSPTGAGEVILAMLMAELHPELDPKSALLIAVLDMFQKDPESFNPEIIKDSPMYQRHQQLRRFGRTAYLF